MKPLTMKKSAGLAIGLLALGTAFQAKAVATPLALRYVTNGVYIHGGVTNQTVDTAFGTNTVGLAFTNTTSYHFYSPPIGTNVSLQPSDKGGGMIYMQNNSSAGANDFSVSGEMRYYDYDPVTGAESLVVDTTASPSKSVNHGQTVNWAIPNALLPSPYIIPAGHMVHIVMTIGLISGDPGSFGQVLINGASGNSTAAYFPQNQSLVLNWPIATGAMTPPMVSSIGTTNGVVLQAGGSPSGS